jgi:hypothetical protein
MLTAKWYFPSFSSTTFRNFPCVSDLRPEVTRSLYQPTLCTDCNTSIVSYLNNISVFWRKESPSFWMLLMLWQSWNEYHVNNRYTLPIRTRYIPHEVDTTLNNLFIYEINRVYRKNLIQNSQCLHLNSEELIPPVLHIHNTSCIQCKYTQLTTAYSSQLWEMQLYLT